MLNSIHIVSNMGFIHKDLCESFRALPLHDPDLSWSSFSSSSLLSFLLTHLVPKIRAHNLPQLQIWIFHGLPLPKPWWIRWNGKYLRPILLKKRKLGWNDPVFVIALDCRLIPYVFHVTFQIRTLERTNETSTLYFHQTYLSFKQCIFELQSVEGSQGSALAETPITPGTLRVEEELPGDSKSCGLILGSGKWGATCCLQGPLASLELDWHCDYSAGPTDSSNRRNLCLLGMWHLLPAKSWLKMKEGGSLQNEYIRMRTHCKALDASKFELFEF